MRKWLLQQERRKAVGVLVQRIWCFTLLILIFMTLSPGQATADALVLGVHPFKPATQLSEMFAPLVAYLSKELGEPVTLRIAKDYQTHIDAVGSDSLDIACMDALSYVEMVEKYGQKPLLARLSFGGNPTYQGKIFVGRDSPIQNLTDLKGKRFAFAEPHSTMGYLMPRYQLWLAGVNIEDFASYEFVGDHVNVSLGVLAGTFDAGAVKEDVFYQYEARGLRAIATTMPVSYHLLMTGRHLPESKRQKLQNILLGAHQNPQGRSALQILTPGITKLSTVQDSDYDSLRTVLSTIKKLEAPHP